MSYANKLQAVKSSRSQAIYVLAIGIVAVLAGALFAWIDTAIHKYPGNAAFILALGLFATVGGAISLARSSRVHPVELEDRWKL